MTWIPCSYCSLEDFSPTLAKWPLTVMIDGAVGCRVFDEGRSPLSARCGDNSVKVMTKGDYDV